MTIQSASFVLVMLFHADERGTAHFERREHASRLSRFWDSGAEERRPCEYMTALFGNSEMKM